MLRRTLILAFGLLSGSLVAIFLIIFVFKLHINTNVESLLVEKRKPVVLGFLPYWLAVEDEKDYSPYINSVAYFGLTIGSDGSIQKLTSPTETEPGWLALGLKKIQKILNNATTHNMTKSLVVFSGNQESIEELMGNPEIHAKKLVSELSPLITKYGFGDLNLDIESFSHASESARLSFTKFTKTVRSELQKKHKSVTLSIDVSPTALIKPYLINVSKVAPYVDKVIFMTYDFHYQGSYVTGAVSPVEGVPDTAEFDVETSIKEALKVLPKEKVILGVPLYGYQWETLTDSPNSAVVPGSGITASNKRVEEILKKCATCEAKFDPVSKESYLIYKDQETDTYIQIFYPDKKAIEEKIKLMKKYNIGGIALWALGYEGEDILDPLKELK